VIESPGLVGSGLSSLECLRAPTLVTLGYGAGGALVPCGGYELLMSERRVRDVNKSIQGEIETSSENEDWVVSYSYRAGSRGSRWEPPEGSEIEIMSMVSSEGELVEGDADCLDRLLRDGLRRVKVWEAIDREEERAEEGEY